MSEPTGTSRAEPRCPICRAPLSEDREHAPFCSDRCRLIDLGKWLGGDYIVSRSLAPDDADDPDLAPPGG